MCYQYWRLALRSARRRPMFLLVAAASLAVGVAAVTTMFAAADTLYLRPIPGVQDPRRVVELGLTDAGSGFGPWNYPDFLDLRERAALLEHTAFHVPGEVSFSENGYADRLRAVYSTSGYFEAVGATPVFGRTFTPLEDVGPGQHAVVVISNELWQQHFGGSRDVLGATLRLNGGTHTVVGVAAEEFRGLTFGIEPDVYLPLTQHPAVRRSPEHLLGDRDSAWGCVAGRMRDGVSVSELNASVAVISEQMQREHPSNATRSSRAVRASLIPVEGADMIRAALAALAALMLLVLAATCANLGGMVLARAASRQRDTAIRLALGSGRTRSVLPIVADVVLVFLVGGAGGVLLAAWLIGLDPNVILSPPRPIPSAFQLQLGWRVPVFGLSLTLLIGVLFGLLPAFRAIPARQVDALREQAGTVSRRGSRLRRVFVAGQVGVSVLLLTSASLFLRSLQQAGGSELSTELSGLYITPIDLDIAGYDKAADVSTLADRIGSRLRELPEVAEAAIGTDFPLDNERRIVPVWPNVRATNPDAWMRSNLSGVAPGYFKMLGISLLAGRTLDARDRAGSARVVVVNEVFASRAWPGANPLGRTIEFGAQEQGPYTVVGVVENTRAKGSMFPLEPQMFSALAQGYASKVRVAVRQRGGAEGFVTRVREAILSVDRNLVPDPTRSMEAFSEDVLAPNRMLVAIGSNLGLVVLLLSALGIHGVIALNVAQRTHEIGVRMALGATRTQMMISVLKRGAILAMPGLAAGAVLAVALGHLLRSMLFGISPLDPVALGVVTILLLAVIAGACTIPARRAAAIQPAEALRAD